MASVHGDDWERVEEALLRKPGNGCAEIQARMVRPDGSITAVSMIFRPVPGDRAGHYVSLRDASLQKQTEGALTHARNAAIASSAAKTRFLAKISHDIRTPLNAILGASDLLAETSLNSDQAEYVSMFQRNCRRLVALINDFLDFSRVEAGAVRIEKVPFRVRQAVHDAVETFRESAWRKGVRLEVELDPGAPDWQLGDSLRLQQVLINLLSNALKFTSQGAVSVKVLAGDPSRRVLRFEVSDTGPGIRPLDRETIFAPFTQLPNQNSTSIRGAGLGLAICRELVTLMGGEIGLSSEEGLGSTFYFTIPIQEVKPPDLPGGRATAAAPLRLGGKIPLRILIAEDTDDNRVLLRHYLRHEPVNLRFAEDGRQALDAVRSGEEFDLILMDIDLPDLDGCTVTKLIREHQATLGRPATPIVALSAHAIQEAVCASLEAGCVAHVAKPVDRATLIETIARHARRRLAPEQPDPNASAVSQAIASLVPKYLASSSRQVADAQACLASRRFDPIQRFGHNLKGTGRGYGFPEIEEMGAALETAAAAADETNIAAQLTALHRFISQAGVAVTSS